MDQKKNIKVSKAELISTFSDIDMKISDLHERSSEDFQRLNNYLKDYHKQARIISENAFRIIETVAGKRELDIIQELGRIHQKLEECREKIKAEDSRKVQVLKEIILKSNQLNILLRNFKQDFTTFKFLSINYSLLSNYEDFELEWKNNLEAWDAEIKAIQQSLTSVSSLVDSFKEQIASNIEHVESRIRNSLKVFQNLSKEIKINIGSVVLKSQESKLQIPLLKEKTAESSNSISEIITHLQYQDIIRQKIEHIQKSHSNIIRDLNESIVMKDDDFENVPEVYSKIGDIADLQAAQLLLVSKEYQNALNIITKNFQGIANDVTTISNISNDFSYKDDDSEVTLLKQIKNELDEGIILLDLNNFREIDSEYSPTCNKLEKIYNQIKQGIQGPLNELTMFDKAESDESGNTIYRPSVLSQIISLTSDIQIKNQDISGKINEIRNLSKTIFTIDDMKSGGNTLEQDRIKLMVEISKTLDVLDKDNDELDNVLNQNRDLNNNVIEKIENVINKVDYYDYFENVVEQVISQLNDINYRLRPVLSEETQDDKDENLKDIKNTYTMKSERAIYDKVVTGQEESGTTASQNIGNEIEFF